MINYLPQFICLYICYALVAHVSISSFVSSGNYNEDFHIAWAVDNVKTSNDGQSRTIQLDYISPSGSGFGSNKKFIFGQYDMKIKLVPGESAGIVVAYYLQSTDAPSRDEIDFEFLGIIKGKPWILQTNVYINGIGNREERIHLWFDPTADFHNYTIHWNIHQLVFMVDGRPIRVHKNYGGQDTPYPNSRPMLLYSTIWDGSGWAPGNNKLNMSYAPFVASFKDYKIDACDNEDPSVCSVVSGTNWWNQDKHKELTRGQRAQFASTRKKFLFYDYCQDISRLKTSFGFIPKECTLPKF